MRLTECPYCKTEIKAKAVICANCHERVYQERAAFIMDAVLSRIQHVAAETAVKPTVSACGAACYSQFAGDQVLLNECLDNCRLASAVAEVAERLHRELVVTFADIVWGGGDIDPLPLEKQVRKRFSRPPK